ncbi:hypothetical protein M405DRAFT_560410 [Rhizopogon salebrosus TDB-379]|nr:hypothetical protein M405DRAFT_560410 [Rhizopogon salebrosus TDB-379]
MTDVSARAYATFSNSLVVVDDLAAAQLWPINAAEKALHELEVYKTPLLPSRLKGAPIPDMFIPKKNRQITLMHDRERERKKGKGKSKMKDRDGINGTKPYAGEGGMKKWLARRQREEEAVRVHEEADKVKEKEQAMDEDEDAEAEAETFRERQKKHQEEEAKRKKELEVRPILKAPAFEPQSSAQREMSSLRVGRSRVRNHIERPSSRRTNKFSAAFEDDEDAMDDDRVALEEAAKRAPLFEIPAGFTFAKEVKIFISGTHECIITTIVADTDTPRCYKRKRTSHQRASIFVVKTDCAGISGQARCASSPCNFTRSSYPTASQVGSTYTGSSCPCHHYLWYSEFLR